MKTRRSLFTIIAAWLAGLPVLRSASRPEIETKRERRRIILPPTPGADGSCDARWWARSFVTYARRDPSIATDEETMISWFANAIMAGYDSSSSSWIKSTTGRNPKPRRYSRSD